MIEHLHSRYVKVCRAHQGNGSIEGAQLMGCGLHQVQGLCSSSGSTADRCIVFWIFCCCEQCLSLKELLSKVLYRQTLSPTLGEGYLEVLHIVLCLCLCLFGAGSDQ